MQYRDEGYLPEALINYLVRLGWGHGDQEIFTQEEMINLFSLNAISKSASAFQYWQTTLVEQPLHQIFDPGM